MYSQSQISLVFFFWISLVSITGSDVESFSSFKSVLALETPTNRVKFLCSQGSKILPLPFDGHLKYTGGEICVIGVLRDIHLPVGVGTAVLVTDPHQLVAYQELKLKYEHLQSKAREVVGVVRPYINPDYEAFGALQELEMLVGTGAIVQSETQQAYV